MGLFIANGEGHLTPQVISNEVLSRHNVYGVTFNGISSKGKPLYNAIDQKWVPATPTDPGIDTWKDLAPFNVKKCITDYDASNPSKRKVLAYEGDENYDSLKTAKTGDRMVEFPLGYYYRPDPWTFIVSPDPIEGFQPSPACDLGNSTILSGFRLSEFDLCNISSVPCSIPGQVPWEGANAQTLKDALKAKGQYLETFGAWCWINFLRIIKQQNLNSQKANGIGISSSSTTRTMTEDNIQGLDGYISLETEDHVRTLGLQNFYGNTNNFLHNVLVHSASYVWIKKDFINADTWPTSDYDANSKGWKKLSKILYSYYSGYITELALNYLDSWALYSSNTTNNTYIDTIGGYSGSKTNDPFSIVAVGGSSGAFTWLSNQPLNILGDFGGRSLEIIL